MTECVQDQFEFQGLGSRRVVADFSGGNVTSDAGGLLLREVEGKRKWIELATNCFTDHRNAGLIEHTVAELLSQRICGVALINQSYPATSEVGSRHPRRRISTT